MNALKRLLQHEHAPAAAFLWVLLCFFFSDVVFTGHSFLSLNQVWGTMPEPPYVYDFPDGPMKPRWPGGPLPRVQSHDPGAVAWVCEPYVMHNRHSFWRGEIPYWNPHAGMGQPHLGSGHAGSLIRSPS